MIRVKSSLAALVALFLALLVASDARSSDQKDTILIKGATVLTMQDDQVFIGDVLVKGDSIVKTGGDIASAEGSMVIDGGGKFLIPGMTEMHGHLPYGMGQGSQDTLFLYLAGGVTTVRGMLGSKVQFKQREKIKAGEIAGPTLYLAAPSLNGNTVFSPKQGRDAVLAYAREGWDLQKIHPGLTRAEYDAIAAAAATVNYPLGGHVPADVGIVRALEAGQASIDHMDGYMQWLGGLHKPLTDEDIARAVALTRASGTWIVPTQALFNILRSGGDVAMLQARAENIYMPKATLDTWALQVRQINASAIPIVRENRQRLLKAFADAGINLALGSDAPQIFSVPGFSIWREIEVMTQAGLSADQILQMATRAPGIYFRDKDRFGQIVEGQRADLLLLEADPRQSITGLFQQAGVMAAGRWYSRTMIDARLQAIAKRHGNL